MVTVSHFVKSGRRRRYIFQGSVVLISEYSKISKSFYKNCGFFSSRDNS